jgi:hypothetical protein
MLRYLVIFLVFTACGCTSTQQKLTLAHHIDVPMAYRSGNFSPEHPSYMAGNSTIERYVNAYERGWLIAVQRYAKNIDFDDPSPLQMNGWQEEVVGAEAGYQEARDRIESLIHRYGKQKVSELLNEWELPEEK